MELGETGVGEGTGGDMRTGEAALGEGMTGGKGAELGAGVVAMVEGKKRGGVAVGRRRVWHKQKRRWGRRRGGAGSVWVVCGGGMSKGREADEGRCAEGAGGCWM